MRGGRADGARKWLDGTDGGHPIHVNRGQLKSSERTLGRVVWVEDLLRYDRGVVFLWLDGLDRLGFNDI